ncbi:MAG: S-layer homology domain-containing protein [Lachnospirales bacterium]
MKKITIFSITIIIVLSCFISIFATNKMNRLIIVGGSTACSYNDDDQYIIKKSGWTETLNSYIGDKYDIVNFTKRGEALSDIVSNNEFKKSIENLNNEDIIAVQIEESDYTKKDLIDNLEYLANKSGSIGYKLVIILPLHLKNDYINELKNPIYNDESILKFKGKNNVDVISANFNEGFESDRERLKFALPISKDNGYDYEAYNYIFADSYAKAFADYIDTGKFNIKNSACKITRGMYVSSLLKFANIDIAKGDNFSDVDKNSEFSDAISTAKALNIVSGDGANFYPDDEITVGDACVIATRLLEKNGYTIPKFFEFSSITPYDEDNNYNEEAYKQNLDAFGKAMGVKSYAVESTYYLFTQNVYIYIVDDKDLKDKQDTKNFTILDIYRFMYDKFYK